MVKINYCGTYVMLGLLIRDITLSSFDFCLPAIYTTFVELAIITSVLT